MTSRSPVCMATKSVSAVAAIIGCINGTALFRHWRTGARLQPSLLVFPPRRLRGSRAHESKPGKASVLPLFRHTRAEQTTTRGSGTVHRGSANPRAQPEGCLSLRKPCRLGEGAVLPRNQGSITRIPWGRRAFQGRAGLQPVVFQEEPQVFSTCSHHGASPALNKFNLAA